MAGGFHLYYEAARALWNLPTSRLEEMAATGDHAHRRAALVTLRVKSEFMTPEAFASERAALTKVASSLSQDPEYTMDMAIRQTGGKIRSLATEEARPARRHLSPMTWFAITAGVLLLILDVLATAGVPVPTPIGDVIDRFTGTDESPVSPAPPPADSKAGRVREPDFVSETSTAHPLAAGRATTAPSPRPSSRKPDVPATGKDKTKNPNHANGRERNRRSERAVARAPGRAVHPPSDPGRSNVAAAGKGRPAHAGNEPATPGRSHRSKRSPRKRS